MSREGFSTLLVVRGDGEGHLFSADFCSLLSFFPFLRRWGRSFVRAGLGVCAARLFGRVVAVLLEVGTLRLGALGDQVG